MKVDEPWIIAPAPFYPADVVLRPGAKWLVRFEPAWEAARRVIEDVADLDSEKTIG